MKHKTWKRNLRKITGKKYTQIERKGETKNMRVEQELKLGFNDVLIRPKRSTLRSRKDVSLVRSYTFRNSGCKWSGVPLMVANMDTTGTFEMATTLTNEKIITCLHKHYSMEEWSNFITKYTGSYDHMALSIGIQEADFSKLQEILTLEPRFPFICIDVANGYSEHFVNFVKKVRKAFPSKIIIAGNVVTGEMVEELLLSGADIIKVGIGPGSVCTTRLKTGVGYPQLSAISECADAAHGLKGHIISDGGCVHPGDFAKAFGAGADFVMAGGIFAGHDESAGEVITNAEDGKQYKLFYGMSSAHAMKKHGNKVANYRASEGKVVTIPYKGSVLDTVRDILGGLRSACTYVGALTLKEISKRTTFVRTNKQVNNCYSK